MTTARVSIIVVSRDRPRLLRRCVAGISQLYYPNFEVVVVCDPDGAEELNASGFAKQIKIVEFDATNISAARNLGLSHASGEVVAFIDDDAVPEPTWLDHLVEPIANGGAVAAGGYVRSRNGITFQWTARDVRTNSWSEPLDLRGDAPVYIEGEAFQGVKTEGTNMAFDKGTVCAMGGFDPAFQFYLDETDLNMRLAKKEAVTAIVPLAQVHHGFASSDKRRGDRAPKSLFHVGRSTKIYLRKHLDEDRHAAIVTAEERMQRIRLLEHMVAGRIDPMGVGRLLNSFRQGVVEGGQASISELAPITPADNLEFKLFPSDSRLAGHVSLNARWYSWPRIIETARKLRRDGIRVTVFRYSLTGLFHRTWFSPDGIWIQKGGLFGRSNRTDRIFRFWTKAGRTGREMRRLAAIRDLVARQETSE